jgi:hypothetical protein
MIHVTFKDKTTALFNPEEIVGVCTWMSDNGEYLDGEKEMATKDLKVGQYILDGLDKPISLSPIASIREV